MHYFPLPFPFLLILFAIFIFVLVLIEVGVLTYAYRRIGIHKRYVFALMLMSLLGSYINIPVSQLPEEHVVTGGTEYFYGVPYVVPMMTTAPGTIIAINLGGAVIPSILSLYLMLKNRLFFSSIAGVFVVTLVVHWIARPVPRVGIAIPFWIPTLLATAVGIVFERQRAPALAYICGTLGTLIGADLLNINHYQGLKAPIVSIGGAGTFDAVFLTGILSVLLASLATEDESAKNA